MNKVLLLLVSMFTVFGVFAEDSPEQYRVRLTKADGTVFEAYNNTSFRNWFKPKVSSISVSEKFKGTATKYTIVPEHSRRDFLIIHHFYKFRKFSQIEFHCLSALVVGDYFTV